ncbi:S-layer homology domain-containing protein [Jeotgalibacillus aurantiacus]|uniref:S-layer homology domain-containing protein n=1 Tax=Jeotgalibacillus aurantiacus TaxID=2763266 RepID=UPI001D0B597C|nr:S-layer homology domain-containing protein [Jeotgalibacillus aurantiacus]
MKKRLSILSAFVVAAGFTGQVNASFKDVTSYKEEISYLSDLKIINGYDNGMFKPRANVTRLQAVQMILREMGVNDLSAPDPGFDDVKKGDYGYDEVAKAVQLGFISGKTDSKGNRIFDRHGSLTRAQMAKVLTEAYELEKEWRYVFRDVSKDHWAKDYVDTLASYAITTGYDDQSFKPNASIQRQHFAVFMARLLNEEFISTTDQKNISYSPDPENQYIMRGVYDSPDYSDSIEDTLSFDKSVNSYWDQWLNSMDGSFEYPFHTGEDADGLYDGWLEDDFYNVNLVYPVEEGRRWAEYSDETTDEMVITATDETITTEAGTFEHVVVVEDTVMNIFYYYAPNVGLILAEEEGEDYVSSYELIEIVTP